MKQLLKVRTLTMWMVAVFATGAFYVLYLALRFETIRLGYEIDRARGEHERLTELHRLVALEVQTLSERQRVNTIASRSLGMGAPDMSRVVVIDGANQNRTLGQRRAR